MARRKLKIMMIAPTPFFADRGCHVRILEEYKHLVAIGHDVIICTYPLGSDIDGVTTYRTIPVPWYKKLSAGPSYHKLYIDVLLFLLCFRKALSFRPDVIHAHLHEGALIGSVIGKALGIPVLADMQGSLFEELADHKFVAREGAMARFWKFLEKKIMCMPDHVVTSSEHSRRLLEQRFQLNERLSSLEDGIDVEFIRPGYPTEELRRRLSIPKDKKIVIYLGLLTPYQGIDCLLEAARIVKGSRKDIIFLICGFPNVELYQRMAKEKGIDDIVLFTGRISYFDAPYYLCLADLGVSAKLSVSEANGKVLNYMAAGLPVVAFDSPVNRELMGELGIYAEFGSPASLAQKILEAFEDEQKMQRLKIQVRKRIEEQWSWSLRVKKLLSVYSSIIEKRAGASAQP